MGKCTLLKVKFGRQSLENELCGVFQATSNILSQRCRASRTKHRQQSTRVRSKGMDPIWSQTCPLVIKQLLTRIMTFSKSVDISIREFSGLVLVCE